MALATLAARVNGNSALVRRGHRLTTDVLIEIGERLFHVSVEQGRIGSVEEGSFIMRRWGFALRAPEAV